MSTSIERVPAANRVEPPLYVAFFGIPFVCAVLTVMLVGDPLVLHVPALPRVQVAR
jgi:hypothetical protein